MGTTMTRRRFSLLPLPLLLAMGGAPSTSGAEIAEETAQPSGFLSAAPGPQRRPAPDRSIQVKPLRPAIDPAQAEAHAAFQRGDLAAAQAAYEKVLDNDPWNEDALHGMAVLNLRLGRPGVAETFFQRALDADPRDAFALGMLAGLQSPADPAEAERRINALLTRVQAAPALLFSLGNLLAAQARWKEAQHAYFKAVAQAPDNPDYLYNLAVSLDHLHLSDMAARHYQQALAAADRGPVAFDRDRAGARLKQLQP